MNALMTRMMEQKDRRRRRLAALPFVEKVRLLVELQAMAAPIERLKGRNVRVWKLDPL
ncbi:MAG: hypothetical protein HY897_19285 [Deltaproteobacteria bacterium]|nr:hypothetical protein [Deltaproteobacteria bacterium]